MGIAVPDPDFLPGWAKKRGIEGSYTEMCKSKVKHFGFGSYDDDVYIFNLLKYEDLYHP